MLKSIKPTAWNEVLIPYKASIRKEQRYDGISYARDLSTICDNYL
jgi:hypothetical protein